MNNHLSLYTSFTIRLRMAAMSALLISGMVAQANSLTDASRASINSSIAIPVAMIDGTAQFFKDSGQLSVTGVTTIGNVSVIGLRGLASGTEASVRVSSKVIEGSAVAAGAMLQASVSATGVLLVSAGKALMFVPNEVGMGLLHHSRARNH